MNVFVFANALHLKYIC